ncbi:MAG: Asp-tRNA(Asn)/Glu-tRNA(Gln) amidotransferase subunit GatB [Candidatus Saccharibacteria bacterium]|nr:Asp-tRNA(Asn)/Glu-tRNA(Gln) amidotransferase subunit GatB [Candidatus Saccharibacteria bacterium]
MSSKKNSNQYLPSIGIECHVQLKTQTKLFAAINNDARQAAPNTLISHICLGMPGSLPVLNKQAVKLSIKASFALNTPPQKHTKFDRKHYFYPDLPKGYQITQLDEPIVLGGHVDIPVEGDVRRIGITRAHLEEDAGKNTHPAGKEYSLVDLNRAGTPLLEIVSEPDMHSADEARLFARELYLLMRYAGVSDADLYHGNMRFDVNVSLSDDPDRLGTRTETKNLNSFRSVERAVEYEIKRQTELLDKGQVIVQETRGWDDAKQKTVSQRGKEFAHDYRYFPDPDIPPIVLDSDMIEEVRQTMPVLPGEWRKRLCELELDASQVETLLEAEIDWKDSSFLGQIAKNMKDPLFAKTLANWYVNLEIPLRRDESKSVQLTDDNARERLYKEVYDLIQDNKLSSTNAKALITTVLTSGADPKNYEKYATEQGFVQVSDEGEISSIVKKVISENNQAALDVQNGELKAIGFLVGQVMKASQGKANPEMAQRLIKEQLGVER